MHGGPEKFHRFLRAVIDLIGVSVIICLFRHGAVAILPLFLVSRQHGQAIIKA